MAEIASRTRILVVDDSAPIRTLLCRVVEKRGFEAIPAGDGLEAVEICQRQLPDLILMDMLMPGMDGFEATRRIREIAGKTWIPILLVSSLDDDKEKVKVLEAGGDDFLSKPVNTFILDAKISSFLRIANMQSELSRYRAYSENERHLAAHMMNHIVPRRTDPPGTMRWELSAERISGDIMLSAISPTGVQLSMLADSTGHGLVAAICLQPAVTIFLAMAEKGFSVSAIAAEMNHRLHEQLPTGQFLAATIVSIDPAQEFIQVWNGGMPAVWLLDPAGQRVHSIEAHAPPLGVFSEVEFDSTCHIYPCRDPVWLMMCSDGLLEAENALGESFGEDKLLAAFAGVSPDFGFARAMSEVVRHIGGEDARAHDDISIALIQAPLLENNARQSGTRPEAALDAWGGELTWDFTIRLGPSQLRSLEVQPMVSSWLTPLHLPADRINEVLTVITELFNNALDHGVLGLDSRLKGSAESFLQYYAMRQERLSNLAEGAIQITIGRYLDQGSPMLKIYFSDSGNGFQLSDSRTCHQDAGRHHGRGMALIHEICESVNYRGTGNEVTACYRL